MSRGKISLAEMMAELERRVVFHGEQERIHGEREAVHRETRSVHAAARAVAQEQLEALRAAASGAEAFLREAPPLPQAPAEASGGDLRLVSRMVALVVREWPAEGGSFGPSAVAAEVNRRFGGRLRKATTASTVSANLRRLCRAGMIHALRPGLPHAEALYEKTSSAS